MNTSRTERALAYALGVLAKVEPQEVVTTGLMTLTTFVLMSGYYLVKTAREPLILLHWGAETKLYIEAAQALILVGVVRAYSAIAARVGRMKLLAIVYLFFASNMLVFAGLAKMKLAIGDLVSAAVVWFAFRARMPPCLLRRRERAGDGEDPPPLARGGRHRDRPGVAGDGSSRKVCAGAKSDRSLPAALEDRVGDSRRVYSGRGPPPSHP